MESSEIKFSEVPTDVLQHHWKANGRPQPPLFDGPPASDAGGYVPPRPRCDYPVPYQYLIDLARDFLLASIVLDYGFLNQEEMASTATECLDEAISTYPERYPDQPLQRAFIRENKAAMIKLLVKTVHAHRGFLRDKLRKMVAEELADFVQDEPPVTYISDAGEVRSIKEESASIIRKRVKHIFRSYLYLDSQRTLCGRNDTNALNSPLLRRAVIQLYDTPVFQRALRVSPSIGEVKNQPTRPLDPDYWMHWSEGSPPLLVSFVGTILSVCYSEWRSGDFVKIRLTSDDHKELFKDVRERIMCDWEDDTYKDAIRIRFHQWVKDSSMVLV